MFSKACCCLLPGPLGLDPHSFDSRWVDKWDGKLGYGLRGYPLIHSSFRYFQPAFLSFLYHKCSAATAEALTQQHTPKTNGTERRWDTTSVATLSPCRKFIAPPALVTHIFAVECTTPEYLIISPLCSYASAYGYWNFHPGKEEVEGH